MYVVYVVLKHYEKEMLLELDNAPPSIATFNSLTLELDQDERDLFPYYSFVVSNTYSIDIFYLFYETLAALDLDFGFVLHHASSRSIAHIQKLNRH